MKKKKLKSSSTIHLKKRIPGETSFFKSRKKKDNPKIGGAQKKRPSKDDAKNRKPYKIAVKSPARVATLVQNTPVTEARRLLPKITPEGEKKFDEAKKKISESPRLKKFRPKKRRKMPAPSFVGASEIYKTNIKVIGVGGAGTRIVSEISRGHLIPGVEFIAVNTDTQSLRNSGQAKPVAIGQSLTRGFGTGMNVRLGQESAENEKDKIQNAIQGADMVFIVSGLGGGTGSGASPVIAETAKSSGALVVGVVTTPFHFEGSERMKIAKESLEELEPRVNTLITISNNNLDRLIKPGTSFKKSFEAIDKILRQVVQSIVDLIVTPGLINVDFADVRAIMKEGGYALIGVGQARGEGRAEEAARRAVDSPLLDVSTEGATGILFSIAGGEDLKMLEVDKAAKIITEGVDPEAKIIFGAVKDNALKGKIRITLIATGLGRVTEKPARDLVEESKSEKHEEERMEIPAFIRRKIKGD